MRSHGYTAVDGRFLASGEVSGDAKGTYALGTTSQTYLGWWLGD